MTPMEPVRMLAGREVLRVVWLPGSDLLLGTCHCGATHVAEGPIEVWEWLLAHPVGHTAQAAPGPSGQNTQAAPGPSGHATRAAAGPAVLSGSGVTR